MKKKIPKRIAAFFITLALSFSAFNCFSVSAFNFTPVTGYNDNGELEELTLRSEAAYMINMDTGDVLLNVNGSEQRPPASLTKIMTAIILLDEFGGDEEKLKSTYYSAGNEAFDELYGENASTADIQPYESVSCYDLLCALMLPSACEAANIIAIGVSGSLEDFIQRMNEKAGELGLENTHFSNCHGLWTDDNYTSCEDVAVMCSYAIENYKVFCDVVSMYEYTMSPTDYHTSGTEIYNTNLMLCASSSYSYSYCLGIKTGTLEEAGRCLASYASYDGERYMIVTMGAPLEKTEEDALKGEENPDSVYGNSTVYYNLIDHINLYEWAFDWIEETSFVDPSSELCEAKVEFGEDGRDYVALKPEYGFSKYWPVYISTDEIVQEITVYDNIVAPVYEGDALGTLTLFYKGETIAEIPLVATESVSRSAFSEKLAVAGYFVHSWEFRLALLLIIGFAVVFTIVHIIRVQRKYMKK